MKEKLTRISQWIYGELFAGKSVFDLCFLLTGILLEIIVYHIEPKGALVLTAGVLGILSVVLGAQGKIINFAFGFVQVIAYSIVSLRQNLYGEVAINIFYFFSMMYGVWAWAKRYQRDEKTGATNLRARKMRLKGILMMLLSVAAVSALTGWGLSVWTNDSDPYFDAFSTMPAFAAQLMMVAGFREQWILWFIIDFVSTWMWLRAGNYAMAMLFGFWLINCFYGYYNWTKSSKEE